ncbi:MAG: hypothetical protein RBT11_07245 [Desulfobacterales bacterium]|jgi:hypothetical protein|nr:hypothetical protein [Desulfobacterales bacterium]
MEEEFRFNQNPPDERRTGPINRRIGKPDTRENGIENRRGMPDRRTVTNDKNISIITGSGEYKGTINLNSARVMVDRVSDFFIKSEIRFVTLYNTVFIGIPGKVVMVSVKDIAMVIPHEQFVHFNPELRQDTPVTIKLKSSIGQITGKINLWGEAQQTDRVSDLLNLPGKQWLLVYDADFRGRPIQAAIINMDFISIVEG